MQQHLLRPSRHLYLHLSLHFPAKIHLFPGSSSPSSSFSALFEDDSPVHAPSSSKSAQNKDEGVVSHESVEKFLKKFMFLSMGFENSTYLAPGQKNRPQLSMSTCEQLFFEGGEYYHLCTKPIEDELLFRTEDELNEMLNFIALATYGGRCTLLAFSIMENHLHFVLEGKREDCAAFYDDLQRRLLKLHRTDGRAKIILAATPQLIPISSLKQLRDEIVYVIRNPFVDRRNVNLFSYKWCSGYLYFNGLLDFMQEGESAAAMPLTKRRAFKHERDGEIDPRIKVLNGVALPSSFTDYRRVESFFEDAREFVHWTLKNVESQVEIAKRFGEKILLDDKELWSVIFKSCKEVYHVDGPKLLSNDNKLRLAKTLKWDYNAGNAQIARCMSLPISVVNDLFPLSTKGPRP